MASASRPRLVAFVVVLLAVATAPALAERAVDAEVQEIAAGLRCPVCQNLSVADSPSEMAQQMRAVIRERIEAGQSRAEIEAYFVSKYGDWVLLAPRRSGFNLVLWLGPFVAAVLGLAVAARLVHRWARRRTATTPPAVDPALRERVRAGVAAADTASAPPLEQASALERERARLYEALRELDFDHRAGKLSAEDHDAMRAEYETRAASVLLALDAEASRAVGRPSPANAAGAARARAKARPQPETRRSSRRAWTALAATFLLVFGATLGVFLVRGLRPRAGETDSITGDFLTGTAPGGLSRSLSFRGNTVERSLADGRAAFERGDFRAAIESMKSVLQADPRHPVALAYLGAILWRAGHADPALETLERALASAPGQPLALWTKGLVLYHAKRDDAGAIRTWEALMAQPLGAEDMKAVTEMLGEARRRLASGSQGPATPAVTRSDASSIAGTVSLGNGTTSAPPGATLLVIARRGAGPPLAVKRIVDPAFPVGFTLGPEDVMLDGARLDGEVTVIARLKRDGRTGAAAVGDLEGVAPAPVKAGATDVRIVLEAVRWKQR